MGENNSESKRALDQKSRLATLGAAVAKINHDLRNSLATAVLVSDKLASSDDPEVKKVTPRLYNAIDKAVALCSQTLNYAGGGGLTLRPALFHLSELVAEVAAGTRREATSDRGAFDVTSEVAFETDLTADRAQLYRVFENLVINARNAGATAVVVSAEKLDGKMRIQVRDDGPGLAQRALDHLFEPFAGSGRDGGSGLGLAIASDIVLAHGGELTLLETGADGTVFVMEMPV